MIAQEPSANNNRIGLHLPIETPENIVLSYQVAGLGARAAAYSVDVFLQVLILVVLRIVASLLRISLPGLSQGVFLLGIFFLQWCYFIFFEGLYRGRSPGKRAMGLRVIHERGHPLTFWGAALRNLLRVVDGIPMVALLPGAASSVAGIPIYGPALISMVLTRKFQRIGDLMAGTVVISERHVVLPREPVIISKISPLDRKEIGNWTPDGRTLSLVEEFLGRSHVLTNKHGKRDYARGHLLCEELAQVVGRKLEYRGDPNQLTNYPMSFLARVYVTFLRNDEEETAWIEGRQPASIEEAREIEWIEQ